MKDIEALKRKYESIIRCAEIENEIEEALGPNVSVEVYQHFYLGRDIQVHINGRRGSGDTVALPEARQILWRFPQDAMMKGECTYAYKLCVRNNYKGQSIVTIAYIHKEYLIEFEIDPKIVIKYLQEGQRQLTDWELSTYTNIFNYQDYGYDKKVKTLVWKNNNSIFYYGGNDELRDEDEIAQIINHIKNA